MKRCSLMFWVFCAMIFGCEAIDETHLNDPIERGLYEGGSAGQELIASFELDNGFRADYHLAENGDLVIDTTAYNPDAEQMESHRRFYEAIDRGMTNVEIYEMFTDTEAPGALIEAEERIVDHVEKENSVEMDENADEESILKTASPELEMRGDGETPPFSEFEDQYCYIDNWSGYHATSTRCLGYMYELAHVHTSTSRKHGTYSVVQVLNSNFVRVEHQDRNYFQDWGDGNCYVTDCSGNHTCGKKVTGSSKYRRRILVAEAEGPGRYYHVWSALLEAD